MLGQTSVAVHPASESQSRELAQSVSVEDEQTASLRYLLRIFGWTCHHMIEGKIQNPLTGNLGQNSFRRFYDASMWWSGQGKITTAWFLPGTRQTL